VLKDRRERIGHKALKVGILSKGKLPLEQQHGLLMAHQLTAHVEGVELRTSCFIEVGAQGLMVGVGFARERDVGAACETAKPER